MSQLASDTTSPLVPGRGTPARLSAERIAEIQARRDASTPGYRIATEDDQRKGYCGIIVPVDDTDLGFDGRRVLLQLNESFPCDADAAFIAHARQDIDDLLASHAALAEELDSARQSEEAIHAKLTALLAGINSETCGCSYDGAGDICLHHSPKMLALTQQMQALAAENARLRALVSVAVERDPSWAGGWVVRREKDSLAIATLSRDLIPTPGTEATG
jgi:hypothetical protein